MDRVRDIKSTEKLEEFKKLIKKVDNIDELKAMR